MMKPQPCILMHLLVFFCSFYILETDGILLYTYCYKCNLVKQVPPKWYLNECLCRHVTKKPELFCLEWKGCMPKVIMELWLLNLCKGGRVCLSAFHLSCKEKSSSNTDCAYDVEVEKYWKRRELCNWFEKESYLEIDFGLFLCNMLNAISMDVSAQMCGVCVCSSRRVKFFV